MSVWYGDDGSVTSNAAPPPPAQPYQTPDPLARVAEHARSVVAADGAEDWPEGLVLEIAAGLRARAEDQDQAGSSLMNEFGGWGDDCDFRHLALAALRVVREWGE